MEVVELHLYIPVTCAHVNVYLVQKLHNLHVWDKATSFGAVNPKIVGSFPEKNVYE